MTTPINPAWRRMIAKHGKQRGGNAHQRRIRRRDWDRGYALANPPGRKPVKLNEVAFSHVLTDDERAIVRGYIGDRYGVA